MLSMNPLFETHVFIIRVKRKTALGRRSDKQGKRQNNVFRKILAYTSLVCRCKYPRKRDACKKCNSQFFCKVSKFSGTLTLLAVRWPIFANLNLNLHTVTTFTLRYFIEISIWNQERNRFLILYLLHKFYWFDFELYCEFN